MVINSTLITKWITKKFVVITLFCTEIGIWYICLVLAEVHSGLIDVSLLVDGLVVFIALLIITDRAPDNAESNVMLDFSALCLAIIWCGNETK